MIGVPVRAGVAVALVLATLVGCGRHSFDTVPEPTFPTSSSPRPSTEPLERADVVGRWVPQGVGRGAYVEFGRRGRSAGGFDGCNRFGWRGWDIAHGRAQVRGGLLSTLAACPSIDTFVSKAQSFALRGDTLVAFDRDGREVGRLHRPH